MSTEVRPTVALDAESAPARRHVVYALLANAPLIAFLLYCRLRVGQNLYVSYRLPLLGELPTGVLTDLTFLLLATLLWAAARRTPPTRILYRALAIPVGVMVMVFRLIDFYYYNSTRVPLNIFVLYGNATMVQEGIGILRASPGTLLFALLVAAHYVARLTSRRYRAELARIAEGIGQSRALIPIGVAVALGAALNLHAVLVHPRRSSTIKSLTAEYQFAIGLPGFLAEQRTDKQAAVAPPPRFYLPRDVPTVALAANAGAREALPDAPRRRPDIFVITVESFNALYAAPAKEINPALTEDVMPFFRSLDTAGFQFTNAYTSSAYTFNGIVSVLCSQYTISETVWGRDCLPEVLRRDGYDAFSFISISQLRPNRFDNFQAMGFDRHNVFGAMRMRRGKKNVFFNFMLDKELFDYAAAAVDSSARVPNRKPIFAHMSTNQMHVPGYFQLSTCAPYPFPPGLAIDRQTRSMLNSARCTDRDIREFLSHLRRSGLYDESLIVITADHAFNINFWTHRESELARVPLFIKLPKSDTTARHVDTAQLAAHIDIAPTIEDYLGLSSARPMYGRSLLRENGAAPRANVAGISSSRLLSIATATGLTLHNAGAEDSTEPALRDEMESLFGTVRYFDSHPESFEQMARTPGQSARWSVVSTGEPSSESPRLASPGQ